MRREKENRKAILSLGKSFKFWDEYKKTTSRRRVDIKKGDGDSLKFHKNEKHAFDASSLLSHAFSYT